MSMCWHYASRSAFKLFARRTFAILFLFANLGTHCCSAKYNVLLIAVDDLRPQLGCYGHDFMSTPNMDQFAKSAMRFDRHYVQVATCGASRFALMTGCYPVDELAFKNSAFQLLSRSPWQIRNFPQVFRENGYTTRAIGKVSHSPDGLNFAKESKGEIGNATHEMPNTWDQVGAPVGAWRDGWSAFFAYAHGKTRTRGKTPPFESADVSDTGYPDGLIAATAIDQLSELEKSEKPFFFAVGFYKPHLPFCAPKRYWDRYSAEKLPLPAYRRPPQKTNPKIAMHNSGEVFGNYGQHPANARQNESYARKLLHGYCAATSYVDAQIGKLMAALNESKLRENTIVVIWGDHGWHLGEFGIWGKHTPYDVATRSALLIRVPGLNPSGASTETIVESIDIGPTMFDLCGIEIRQSVDGQSFAPLLRGKARNLRSQAVSFWVRGKHIAASIRTDQHRFIRWTDRKTNKVVQRELYDHREDPMESTNVVDRDDVMATKMATLLDAVLESRVSQRP